jgi:hypothetical protein
MSGRRVNQDLTYPSRNCSVVMDLPDAPSKTIVNPTPPMSRRGNPARFLLAIVLFGSQACFVELALGKSAKASGKKQEKTGSLWDGQVARIFSVSNSRNRECQGAILASNVLPSWAQSCLMTTI